VLPAPLPRMKGDVASRIASSLMFAGEGSLLTAVQPVHTAHLHIPVNLVLWVKLHGTGIEHRELKMIKFPSQAASSKWSSG
jgi:hypothetical protein